MVKCPICQNSYEMFNPYGVNLIPNRCCPHCGSLERHRVLQKILERLDIIPRDRPIRLLDIAPTKGLKQRLNDVDNILYLSIDLNSPLADLKMDVQNLQFPDGSFDIVICYHVLEHIKDDFKAMREIHRCLKQGGLAIIQVPIKKDILETIEGKHIEDPQERKRLFGQEDHLRYYGLDFKKKIEKAGFAVSIIGIKNLFSEEEISLYRLDDQDIYLAQKPTRVKKIIKIDERHYKVEGYNFNFIDTHDSVLPKLYNPADVLIKKPKGLAEYYRDFLAEKKVEYLLEFGVAEGGDSILFNCLFELKKFVGIELAYSEVVLKQIYDKGYQHKCKIYFKTSQSDMPKIRQIIEENFPEGIDLIVDDASHIFEHTIASFEASFPYLRPYGYYVIEDWGWCHWPGFVNHPFVVNKQGALTNLIALLIMMHASNPTLLRNIHIVNPSIVVLQKGNFEIKDPSSFSIKDYIKINSPESLFLFNFTEFFKEKTINHASNLNE